MIKGKQVLAKALSQSRFFSTVGAKNHGASGVAAIEAYFPNQYVLQSELEQHDGVSSGKYTKGLGQNRMAFLSTDREDTVSMCMTAVHNLLDKYDIDPKLVGRLEVGSETPIDKSKSIKSNLMPIFGEHSDIEGIDNVHACYGGTAALLNSLYWLEANKTIHANSNKKNKQPYAIVVCGDVSNYKDKAARPSGGAGAVAMLLSANGDAPLHIDLSKKASHYDHVYDFYKPDPVSPFPIVDGHYSNSCYLDSLDKCYQRFLAKLEGDQVDLSSFDHVLFHAPYNKLVQKSLARLVFNDARILKQLPKYLESVQVDEATISKVEPLLHLVGEASFTNKDIEKVFAVLSAELYKSKTESSATLSKELGNCYTASLYAGLASLINNEGKNLEGKKLGMFSYGSGSAATLYEARGVAADGQFSFEKMQKALDLDNRLNSRAKVDPVQYEAVIRANVDRYHKCDFKSDSSIDLLSDGTYYLESIDSLWRRTYNRK